MTIFVDTSALAKLYVQEAGSSWMLAQLTTAQGVYVSRLIVVEMASSLARRGREGQLSLGDIQAAQSLFGNHLAHLLLVVELDPAVSTRASELVFRRSLRSLDAVQLATAMSVDDERRRTGMSPLTFLTADIRLNAAASAEGLLVDDPNQHP